MIAPDASIPAAMPDLSSEALIIAVIAVTSGLILWAVGGRILRPSFLTIGGIIGAVSGYVIALAIEAPVPPWTVAVAGGIVLAVIAWLAYRPAIALTLAMLLGAACPIAVIAWAESRGMNLVNPPAAFDAENNEIGQNGRELDAIWQDIERTWSLLRETEGGLDRLRSGEGEISDADDAQDVRSPEEVATSWREHLEALAAGIIEDLRLRWDAAPEKIQRTIMLSAACGAILGFFIGLTIPAIAASVLTALSGAGLMVGGGSMAAHQLGVEDLPVLQAGPMTWLAAWLILAAVGVAVQWTFRGKRADKESD